MIGTTVSHYRIVEKLGQGSMGVVYRAEDTTLGLQMSIRVLREAFAGEPERMARFEPESRLLASLSRQYIAAIRGRAETDGKQFMPMDLAKGQTLATRICRGGSRCMKHRGCAGNLRRGWRRRKEGNHPRQ